MVLVAVVGSAAAQRRNGVDTLQVRCRHGDTFESQTHTTTLFLLILRGNRQPIDTLTVVHTTERSSLIHKKKVKRGGDGRRQKPIVWTMSAAFHHDALLRRETDPTADALLVAVESWIRVCKDRTNNTMVAGRKKKERKRDTLSSSRWCHGHAACADRGVRAKSLVRARTKSPLSRKKYQQA